MNGGKHRVKASVAAPNGGPRFKVPGGDQMVELRVPARQEMLLVVRMTLSGLCAKCGMGMDAVENIRIAVDEACYCLIHQTRPVAWLKMTCTWDDERLFVRLEAERSQGPSSNAATHDPEVAQCILSTLVPEVDMRHDDGGVYGIDLVIRLNAA